jgi:predicted RNA-binding protein Jag
MEGKTRSLVETFFQGLGIVFTELVVEVQDQDIQVSLQTPDSALLIGMHGKNMEVFQHLLGRMIEKLHGQFVHVHLEVNDYMKAKDERLFRFLDNKIQFVTSTGKSSMIPNLNAYERKKAHHYISEKAIAGLVTHSEGTPDARILCLEYTGEIQSHAPQSSHIAPSHSVDDLSEDGVGI